MKLRNSVARKWLSLMKAENSLRRSQLERGVIDKLIHVRGTTRKEIKSIIHSQLHISSSDSIKSLFKPDKCASHMKINLQLLVRDNIAGIIRLSKGDRREKTFYMFNNYKSFMEQLCVRNSSRYLLVVIECDFILMYRPIVKRVICSRVL